MLPTPPSWRSEAFAEDLVGEALATAAGPHHATHSARHAALIDRAARWTTLIAPLLVVVVSVLAAVVPPLA